MPISTPVLPLRVSSTSHAPLVKWRRERRKYEETIPNRTKGDTDNKIVPVKTTFDEGLLRMRCRLLWRLSIGNVTDEQILTEIDKIIASAKNNSVRDGDREMREMLRMDLFVRYVSEIVIQYFKLCHDFIDDRGWQKMLHRRRRQTTVVPCLDCLVGGPGSARRGGTNNMFPGQDCYVRRGCPP
ncbi:hypothetical protein PC116_g20829 [Phytophthora cactorum]|uniref:Uncharacterized protein n=1 Tax=Phytophthora cactorum TaxID=29920 RepID=A0A329RKH2_9STRA|nr:hypothetical protein Pcac1_g5881 [Phytophthora cactorum]KAG2813693.1 hypothetical protein PC112_g14627 [Phytophthora cactorum]KAG2815106.1 hypothetical protein PC111_g13700 [Phytophthora cactorum]KAG2850518.1 hypothetical protein PC113_g16705 [Phytophthora cactorum]KAG2888408.1 hypothetical protein PC114_g18421 [Phytophthora cactorum]